VEDLALGLADARDLVRRKPFFGLKMNRVDWGAAEKRIQEASRYGAGRTGGVGEVKRRQRNRVDGGGAEAGRCLVE
jgi:hypothetical protein